MFVFVAVVFYAVSRYIPCREYNYGGYGYTACGYYEYDCLDPEAPTDCDTDSPTPSPAEGSGYPGCEGYIYSIGDGYCESQNNNEECGWDGGRSGGRNVQQAADAYLCMLQHISVSIAGIFCGL